MTNDKKISDACKAWIKRCERDELERAPLRSYRNYVDHHIEPAIGDREWIDNNMALSVKLRRASRNAPVRIIPTKGEIKAMLETVSDKQHPLITTAI